MSGIGGTSHLLPSAPIIVESASWDLYSRFLAESGGEHLRVTYDQGRMEFMSPLPMHGRLGHLLGRLVETLCEERAIEVLGFEDTTFRSEPKQRGLEPDKCYYIQNVDAAREMDDFFDPSLHPPPDLAIEVEVTRRLIAREPIYASLGVPEIWRVRVGEIACLHLVESAYIQHPASLALPFLKPADLWAWANRLRTEKGVAVLPEFRRWVRSLA